VHAPQHDKTIVETYKSLACMGTRYDTVLRTLVGTHVFTPAAGLENVASVLPLRVRGALAHNKTLPLH